MGSSFGRLFKISTWGESHGGGVGVVVDGCPPRVPISLETIQRDLDRRRPGQSALTTQRKEADTARFLSGIKDGLASGTPIAILVDNTDARPEAYDAFRDTFRPSHADYTYQAKYGIRIHEGGGRSSARETIARVAAGSIARQVMEHLGSFEIRAYVSRIHDLTLANAESIPFPPLDLVESTPVRCPCPETAARMIQRIKEVRSEGDSVGGVITCRIRGLPAGLGDPVFDRFEADLAKAMLSIPATKGFEIGSGFSAAKLRGSEHNDLPYADAEGRIRTHTNRAGGVLGGITNGEDIVFNVAFKPTATILKPQESVNLSGEACTLVGKGRHDPCVLPRAVVIVEAMASLVCLDHWMRQSALNPEPAHLNPPRE